MEVALQIKVMCVTLYKMTDVGFPSDGSLFALPCVNQNNLKQSAGTESERVGRGAGVLLGVALAKSCTFLERLLGTSS